MPGETQVASPLAMLMPYLQLGLGKLLDSMFSGKYDLLKFSNIQSGLSFNANFQSRYESNLQKNMFGYYMQDQSEEQARRLISAGYRVLGYDQISADEQSRKPGMKMVGWAIDTFLGDQWNEGLSAVYGSAFNRRYYESSNRNYYRLRHDYRQLGDELLDMHYKQRAFGTASFTEVGNIAAELIGSGRYDTFGRGQRRTVNAEGKFVDVNGRVLQEGDKELAELQEKDQYGTGYWERNADGSGKLVRRADVIAKDTKQYIKALTNLQDVLGGDMPQILDTLDKLFGTKATNMSAQRLNNLTANIRDSMHASGMSLEELATLAGTGFSYIAPFGGTEAQGVSMATTTAYFTGAGISVEGMNKDRFAAELTRKQANIEISGDSRYMAAAFKTYVDSKGLDEHDSKAYESFLQALGNTPMTAGDLLKWMHKIAPNFSNSYFQSILNSDNTTKLIEEHNMTGTQLEQVLETTRKKMHETNKSVGTYFTQKFKKNVDIEGMLKDADGMTLNAKQNIIEQELKKQGFAPEQITEIVDNWRKRQNSTLEENTGMSAGAAETAEANLDKAREAKKQAAFNKTKKEAFAILGKEEKEDEETAGGVEGAIQAMFADIDDPDKRKELGELVFGAIGLTQEAISGLDATKLNDAAYLDEIFEKKENKESIAKRYKQIFGKTIDTKDSKAVKAAAKEIYAAYKSNTDVISPFADAQAKDKLTTNESYDKMIADADAALIALTNNKDATEEERKAYLATVQKAAENTKGEAARRLAVAAREDMLDEMNTKEGKEKIDKIIEHEDKTNAFLNKHVKKGSEYEKTRRERIGETIQKLEEATAGVSDKGREEIANALKVNFIRDHNGRVQKYFGFDAEKRKELQEKYHLSDEQMRVIEEGGQTLFHDAEASQGKTGEDRFNIVREAITLPNSHDPVTNMGSSIMELLQQILDAVKSIIPST